MTAAIWRIERLVPGGDGFLRLDDGRAGFAEGALPGDRIRVLAVKQHKSWMRAERWELVAPGPERVAAPCPMADACGGCEWMHLARPAQIAAKASLVREALERTGGLRDLPAIELRTVGPDLGYRCRLRLHVDADGRVGLYAKKSHRLVEIPGCPVSAREVEDALGRLREVARPHTGVLARWSEIEIRTAPAGPPLTLWLVPRE